MAQLTFDSVINLTSTSTSAPRYSDKLFIGHEPMNSVWQYCLRGDTLLYKEALVDNANYNALEWHTVIPNSIQRACKNFSLKTFPGIGAIGCFTPTYGSSKFLMPIHVRGVSTLAAPQLRMVDHGTTVTFIITPPTGTEYKCYRILLQKVGYAEEHITYSTTVSVTKPSVNGTYTCYCIGYVDEGSRVSADSNAFTIVVTDGTDQPTPVSPSYATVDELNELSESVEEITNAEGTGVLDELDDLILSWCCESDTTFINGSKIYTGTVKAEQIDTGAITAEKLSSDYVSALNLNIQTAAKTKADDALEAAKTFVTTQGYLTVDSDKIKAMVEATKDAQDTADSKITESAALEIVQNKIKSVVISGTNGTTATQSPDGFTWTIDSNALKTKTDSLVADVATEYYLSTSSTALVGGEWVANAPDWVDGKYMWSRTKTVDGAGNTTYTPSENGTCIAGAKGSSGEDAVTLRIDSSRGTVFKNNSMSTVLSVVVYKGSERITNITELRASIGSGAYLEWYWQKIDESEYGVISATDKMLSNDGFNLTISAKDVDTKVTFRCELKV